MSIVCDVYYLRDFTCTKCKKYLHYLLPDFTERCANDNFLEGVGEIQDDDTLILNPDIKIEIYSNDNKCLKTCEPSEYKLRINISSIRYARLYLNESHIMNDVSRLLDNSVYSEYWRNIFDGKLIQFRLKNDFIYKFSITQKIAINLDLYKYCIAYQNLNEEYNSLLHYYNAEFDENKTLTRDYDELLGDYNTLVDKCNASRDSHNTLVGKYNKLLDKYNKLRDKHNKFVREYNTLLNEHKKLAHDTLMDEYAKIALENKCAKYSEDNKKILMTYKKLSEKYTQLLGVLYNTKK